MARSRFTPLQQANKAREKFSPLSMAQREREREKREGKISNSIYNSIFSQDIYEEIISLLISIWIKIVYINLHNYLTTTSSHRNDITISYFFLIPFPRIPPVPEFVQDTPAPWQTCSTYASIEMRINSGPDIVSMSAGRELTRRSRRGKEKRQLR